MRIVYYSIVWYRILWYTPKRYSNHKTPLFGPDHLTHSSESKRGATLQFESCELLKVEGSGFSFEVWITEGSSCLYHNVSQKLAPVDESPCRKLPKPLSLKPELQKKQTACPNPALIRCLDTNPWDLTLQPYAKDQETWPIVRQGR